MDITPTPVRFCFLHPRRVQPPIIQGASPTVTDEGVICSSRCPIFTVVTDAKGKPTGGECSIKFSAIALVNLEQNVRAALEQSHPPAGGKIN